MLLSKKKKNSSSSFNTFQAPRVKSEVLGLPLLAPGLLEVSEGTEGRTVVRLGVGGGEQSSGESADTGAACRRGV